jgi:hypothetical protein
LIEAAGELIGIANFNFNNLLLGKVAISKVPKYLEDGLG